MFALEMLPAEKGDCLLIEYGQKRNPRRILIDGGVESVYNDALRGRLELLTEQDRADSFDLVVITHVDLDHIQGIVKLLADASRLGLRPRDVWFNGWNELSRAELGALEGEVLSEQIEALGWPKNTSSGLVDEMVVVPEVGPLPEVTLAGGMKLTLLSPGPQQLIALRLDWTKVLEAAGLKPPVKADALAEVMRRRHREDDLLGAASVDELAAAPFLCDDSPANGSSIAMLAEYGGKSCLLAGDAYAPVLAASLKRLLSARARQTLYLDAFKLPHHGSRYNLTSEVLKMVPSKRYLVSTNGARFGSHPGHPNDEAIARVLVSSKRTKSLIFNYGPRPQPQLWDRSQLMLDYKFGVVYPTSATGIRVEI
jgi:beta-lactamase superfamily II metal-dependent hydrolase